MVTLASGVIGVHVLEVVENVVFVKDVEFVSPYLKILATGELM